MSESVDDVRLGPDATLRALASAWASLSAARSVVLVEGVSDVVGVEAAAIALGHDLTAAGVVLMPINGAQAIGRTIAELDDRTGPERRLGLCDRAEASYFRAVLSAEHIAICHDDLEEELIRAAGDDLVERVIDDLGERRAFRTLQAQAPWRDAARSAQVHRFIRSRSGRGQRYAAELIRAVDPSRIPAPLQTVVELAVG